MSRSSPSTPSAIYRSCQRHTQVFDLPVAAMIATVPKPSSVSRMIRARHTCFCGVPRAPTRPPRRARSRAVTTMLIPLRMHLRRTSRPIAESPIGLFRSDQSTSLARRSPAQALAIPVTVHLIAHGLGHGALPLIGPLPSLETILRHDDGALNVPAP